MKKLWKTVKALLYPPLWVTLLLSVLSTVALVAVFTKGLEKTAVAYGAYVLSAYALTVVTAKIVKVIPKVKRSAKEKVYSNSFGNRYMTDAAFKVRISLYISLGINLLYSAFKLWSGVYYSSFWWGAFAVYYIILAIIRFFLLRYMNRKDGEIDMLSEYRRYRLSAILMVLLNLSLAGIVFQMVWQDKGFSYPEVIVIASAAYTFYTVTVSIIDLVRYRKYNRPVISASKAIRFAAALVSLLNLETAMLALYGEDEGFRALMVALTGGGVCIGVLTVSVYMIIKSTKEIGRIKNGK